ncbi:MAG TPA: 2Fe-2S iron-sulfur cluster-binding protein [Candidatus Sphingobacterium stercoripullorum]|nr:2Fe-2S iron-sulfur cluster-binding protein [Candidatus Sphingobacterium stercoripullorum]
MGNQRATKKYCEGSCWVNGQEQGLSASETSLLEWLRDLLAITDVRKGCDSGHCGSCAVVFDGQAVKACSILASDASGRTIFSLKGLPLLKDPVIDSILSAEQRLQPFQCAYCKPAFMLAAYELLRYNSEPTAAQIKQQFSGLLCRCTGYQSIVMMVLSAAEQLGNMPEEECDA